MHENYDWRQHGYWHIARTQVMRAAEITQKLGNHVQSCYCDDSRFTRGGLIEVTFEPTFVRYKKLLPRRLTAIVVPPPSRNPGPAPPADGGQGPAPPAGGPQPDQKKKKPRRSLFTQGVPVYIK